MVAFAAITLALAVGVLASNFIGGEKKIERHIQRLWVNGEQIFPPMLAVQRNQGLCAAATVG